MNLEVTSASSGAMRSSPISITRPTLSTPPEGRGLKTDLFRLAGAPRPWRAGVRYGLFRRGVPGLERVVHALHCRRQGRKVPGDHVHHRGFLDPLDAVLGIDLGAIVPGEEPVALQAPRRHQDEEAEGGLAEAEPWR